jgi:phage terminase large subunit
MAFETGPLYDANYAATAPVVINQGGTRSGKTYQILQVLITKLAEEPNRLATVVGQDIPNLKKGPIRLMHQILDSSPALASRVVDFNKSDRVLSFVNGSVLEFTSFDDAQDAKSGERDYSFTNEANGISWEIWEQINLRTRIRSFIDYNPDSEFWVHEKILKDPNMEHQLFISDHRSNPFVTDLQRQKIENIKNYDLELWKVYARGLTGKVEGLIIQNWAPFKPKPGDELDPDGVPRGAKFLGHGMDFGFTNDPTTLMSMWQIDDETLLIQERIYESGMTGADIHRRLKDLGISRSDDIWADSAEPRLIAELRQYGWRMRESIKGPDSIITGIDTLKRYKILVMPGSPNCTKELKSYKWATDTNGKPLNKPIPMNDHTIDPLRYIAAGTLRKPKREGRHYEIV